MATTTKSVSTSGIYMIGWFRRCGSPVLDKVGKNFREAPPR